ncbi:MAG: Gfo/Idh/MocA family protein [Armatimonadota bacterium]
MASPRIFNTDRRIRLGIWGLGRGMNFYRTCQALNIDVVAGCDYNAHMREGFLEQNPGAFVTADAEEFLAGDFDAVLLATFCPDHAGDALRCLAAGKHVLSEVTAFHTLAEGVRLVEAVEQSGLVYNLAENYPFTAANMYLARRWKEGLFGELMYAEYEYVHEIRSLAFTYIDGMPVQPGNTVHSWRSWLHWHYYCTHSLGPMMVITGLRPTRVVALPVAQLLPGYLQEKSLSMGGIAPSLINMSNGAVVRNLMGATTNDTHVQRIWGTKGSAELNVGKPLTLRLGGSGSAPKMEVTPHWDALGELAQATGHGGGDFWVLYYFARQILYGDSAPFDIYAAADVTIPGILAVRSSLEGGTPQDVPDFRLPEARGQYRQDEWAQPRYDTKKGAFPAGADYALTGQFSAIMSDLIRDSLLYRAYADWARVEEDMVQPEKLLELLERLLAAYPRIRETYAKARTLIDAYPESDGARVLREMLVDVGDEEQVLAPDFLPGLQRRHEELQVRAKSVSHTVI